jgi:RimJ/RimL family protein N-acetyltransferase
MYFKKLVGKRCFLSPVDINDAEKFTEWLNDMEVIVNLTFFHRMININDEKVSLEKLSKEHNYSIIDLETNEMIGNCGYINIDHLNQCGDIGIFIGNKNYWNKGYGSEALTLLLDYGFKALNLHNVQLCVYSFNKRAIKSYKKVGFKIIGNKREALKRGNEFYDIIYMDILEKEFYENNEIIKKIHNNKE